MKRNFTLLRNKSGWIFIVFLLHFSNAVIGNNLFYSTTNTDDSGHDNYVNTLLAVPTDSVCTLTDADTFFINSIPNAISYDWIVPAGATFTQLTGDSIIVIDWTSAVAGIDSIGVAAINSCGPGDTTYFPLRILVCNQPPDAITDYITLTEDTINAFLNVQLNDSDPDNDPLTTTIISSPTSGGIANVVNDDSLSYTPPLNFYGIDTIVYQICDNAAIPECDIDTVFITVDPVNDAPIAVNDTTITGEEILVTYNVTINDSDPNDPLEGLDLSSIQIITSPSNGLANTNTSTGEISYTPSAGFHGTDSLQYSICDNGSPTLCDTAIFYITVPTEDCTNGLDDDGDGLIDCADPDCGLPTPGTITGLTTLCGNAVDEMFSVPTVTGATNYTWTIPADAVITSGQGTPNITITWGETDGDICVTASDGVCTSAPSCITISTTLLDPIGNIQRY